MLYRSAISAIQLSTLRETKPCTGPSKASIRSIGLKHKRVLTPDSRCMFDNRPTRVAMILLEGCVSYVRGMSSGKIIITNKSGKKVWVNSKQTDAISVLVSFGYLKPMNTRGKITPFYKAINEIPLNRHRWFTSVRGVKLLREWAKRDNFKPFFNAYAGHITDDMLDAQVVLSEMEDNKNLIPIWIKGRESMQPRENVTYAPSPF